MAQKEKEHHYYDTIRENVGHFIGTVKHTVGFQSDNTYILRGYRINYNTPYLILKSLFHKHNELINIWTHIIGAILALLMIVYVVLFLDLTKFRLVQDIQQIFTIQPYQNSSTTTEINESMISDILQQIEVIEKKVITSDSYKEIVNLLNDAVEIVQARHLAKYSEILQDKFDQLKEQLINQIDSEQFDWVEIYKHEYKHAPIIKQEQIYRKFNDPLHVSRWPILVFLISAIMCMGGSACFHLFFQMSEKANKYLLRVDYGGISLLILGSSFPPFYYGFYCETFLRYFYLATVGTACLAAYIVSIFDFIHTEKWRRVKGAMYGSLGIFAGVPAIHLYLRELYGPENSDYLPFQYSFIYYLLMGASYLGGLAIYTFRIPERFFPGKFDIIGQSHNIWHVCVFLGVLFSYFGALENLADRRFQFCII